ncbi:hypothetical protein [Hydrogenimonas sp.]
MSPDLYTRLPTFYLGYIYGLLPGVVVIGFMALIGWLLNSRVKVPHP